MREYISLEENNLNPLPTEAEDGTYEGDEHWGVTIPPVVDFYPDYATGLPNVVGGGYAFSYDAKGTGSTTFIPEEDGWYNFEAWYDAIMFLKDNGFGTPLYESQCALFINDEVVARLDGKLSFYRPPESENNSNQGGSVVNTTIPLRKGVAVKIQYKMWSDIYWAKIVAKRWGGSTL